MGDFDPNRDPSQGKSPDFTSSTMPPFRNFLRPKTQPNGDPAILDENHLSPNQRPAPIPIRSSQDEPTEYKLSGMFESPALL